MQAYKAEAAQVMPVMAAHPFWKNGNGQDNALPDAEQEQDPNRAMQPGSLPSHYFASDKDQPTSGGQQVARYSAHLLACMVMDHRPVTLVHT